MEHNALEWILLVYYSNEATKLTDLATSSSAKVEQINFRPLRGFYTKVRVARAERGGTSEIRATNINYLTN